MEQLIKGGPHELSMAADRLGNNLFGIHSGSQVIKCWCHDSTHNSTHNTFGVLSFCVPYAALPLQRAVCCLLSLALARLISAPTACHSISLSMLFHKGIGGMFSIPCPSFICTLPGLLWRTRSSESLRQLEFTYFAITVHHSQLSHVHLPAGQCRLFTTSFALADGGPHPSPAPADDLQPQPSLHPPQPDDHSPAPFSIHRVLLLPYLVFACFTHM